MLRSGFFGYLWKLYALERKFRVENGGLKNGTYPKCTYMYMEVPPGGFTNKILLTDWEESHVSDAKVPKFRVARSARSQSFMCFSRVSGRNKSSWTRQGYILLYRQTMWFINIILRRVVCFRPKNTPKNGSLAISIAFSWVSGFLVGIKKKKTYRRTPGRRTRTHTSFCQELIVLPGTCVELLTPASPYH